MDESNEKRERKKRAAGEKKGTLEGRRQLKPLRYSVAGEKKYYLLVEQLARLLLDGINELHLSGREAHQQGHALRGGREVVEVMTRRLRPLVDALVYGLT